MPRSRKQIRQQFFPDSDLEFWRSEKEKGYFCAPRLLPILLLLASDENIVGEFDCRTVYVELLSRVYQEGIVTVRSEKEHAFLSGYCGQRAARSWRERIAALEAGGFIRASKDPFGSISFVLVRHPLHVLKELTEANKLSGPTLEIATKIVSESKIEIPEEPAVAPSSPPMRLLKKVLADKAQNSAESAKMSATAANVK